MAANVSSIFIQISSAVEYNVYPTFNNPIQCIFTRYIRSSDPKVAHEIQDEINIDVNRNELRDGITLNFGQLAEIQGRYRLSIDAVTN